MKTKTIAVIGVVLVVLGLVVWWFVTRPATQQPGGNVAGSTTSAPSGLGGQVYDQIQGAKTTELPKTNPFEAQTNPYKGAYTNPFGQ